MNRNKNYQNNQPTLFLISTPIGNLEDITLRALRIMKEVDILFAEDTRVSSKLLAHYQMDKPLHSFYLNNEKQATETVLAWMDKGLSVGLMSDAGMPLISDPGAFLVEETIKRGYNVVCLPGANAALTALAMSGITPQPFLFRGFLDAKDAKRKKELQALQYKEETLVFYEAPHRLTKFMKDLDEIMPNRDVAICREISKTYEEIIRGKPHELKELTDLKGEMVIVVSGYVAIRPDVDSVDIVKAVDGFVLSGLSKTEAMKKVAELTAIPKNKIYQEYLEKTKKQ